MKWPHLPLSTVAVIGSGSGFPTADQGHTNGEFPFLKVSDMNLPENARRIERWNNTVTDAVRTRLRATAFPAGSVIFPKIGAAIATNKKRLLTRPCCVDNNVMAIVPDRNKLDSEFLYFLLRTKNLSDFASDSNPPSIRKTTVEEWCIPLPPLEEQQRVVDILSRADGIVRLRREAQKKASEIIPALFLDMFGEPATNPRRWPLLPFGQTFDDRTARYTKIPRRSYQETGRFPVIDQGQEFIAGYTDTATAIMAPKDAVVVFGDHTRCVKLVDFPFVIGADGAKVLVPRDGFLPRFAAALLRASPIPDLGYSRHMREVKRLSFMQPPTALQLRFAGFSAELTALAAQQTAALRAAEATFEALLARAFSEDGLEASEAPRAVAATA